MAPAPRPAPGAASLRLLQSLAIGVELANGWHTWHEVLNRGDMLALPLCIGGLLLGSALTHAASRKSGAQVAVGSSLFWLSCTLSGGLLAIAQLRLRLQTANEDAFFVNALVSSALLGCCLPHAVREMLVCPSAEVLMPCIFAVLVTEVVCSQDAFPQFQALAGLFLLFGGLQGLAVADVSQLSPAERKTGAAMKAPRAVERQGGPGKEKEPPADPFFPATVLESQKYSPHFMVKQRRRCLAASEGGDPLLQLVARQAPETQRGKAKAEAKRRDKAPMREPVPFDPLPGEAPPRPVDPSTRNRRHSETSEATQLSLQSQGSQGAAAAEDSHAVDEAPEPATGESMEEKPEHASSALLETAKPMVARAEEDAPGDGESGGGAGASRETATEVPQPDFGLQKQAPSLNAAAAAFVPSVGAVPATYAEPYAEPYVEPYVEPGEAFAVEPYAEVQAPFSGYAPMDGPGTAMPSEVPFAGHGMDAMHAEALYPGMDGDAYDGFGHLMGQDPYAYQDYSQMQAWSWNEAQPFAGDGLPAGGFPPFRTPGAFHELGMTDDGSDESGREPGRPMASPLDDQLPDPGAGRASEARRSAKDLRKAGRPSRGASANAILISAQQTMDEEAVRSLCEPFGMVVRASVMTDREGGTHSAMVEFAEMEETERALKGLQSRPNIWVRRPAAVEGRREPRRGVQPWTEKGKPVSLFGNGKSRSKGSWHPRSGADCHWAYIDPKGVIQVGFTSTKMRGWFEGGYFKAHLEVCPLEDSEEKPLRSSFKPLSEWFPDISQSFLVKPVR